MKKRIMTLYACLAVFFAAASASTAFSADSPEITDPKPGSTLPGESQFFSWTDNGASVEEWQLTVGTSLGAHDVYDSGPLSAVSQGCYVSGLSTDGSTLYVRLFYRIGMFWASRDYTYTAAASQGIPIIYDPPQGSVISGDSKLFQWISNGADVATYYLVVGSNPGADDIYESGTLQSWRTTNQATGLPMDGSTVYVRLYYGYFMGLPLFVDYSYTSTGTPKITSPAPGSTLSRDLQTFTWTDNGNNVSSYQLSAGSSPGGNDIFDIPMGTSNSAVLNGLPADGGAVYVTLGYLIDGVWGETQSTYIAQGNPGFTSDFKNNQDGWYNPGAGHWDYGDGVFVIRIYLGTVYFPTFVSACYRCVSNDDVDYEDFEYEADIFTAGADRDYTGIIFRGNPWPMLADSYNVWNSGYAFVIGKDGFYQILKIRDCSLYTLKDWTKSDAINQGEYTSNTLKVSADGPNMDFFINGFYVATIVDQEYTKGNVRGDRIILCIHVLRCQH